MPSGPYSVSRLAAFALTVDAAAFREKLGGWVLVGPPGETNEEEWAFKTGSVNAIQDGTDLIVLDSNYEVYPLRKATDGPFASTLLVGRADSNDICIQDLGISKLHASIFLEDGALAIEDANSSNGTVLEAHVLTDGERKPLQDGNYVTFGNRQFCLLSPERFYGILRKYAGEPMEES